MQSASDVFLGWTAGRGGRQFYIRQLRDAKIKPMVETFNTDDMVVFAQWCGHSLARSHARSGDAAMISGYLGESDTFDRAITDFSAVYADQTERDHAALKKAASSSTPMMEGPGADSEEKHEPVSDIYTVVVVVGLKALDPEWPIREAMGWESGRCAHRMNASRLT